MSSCHERFLRADLHVHSYHSGYAGRQNVLRARDCYSEPEAVYRTAKARGMDLVTITDHDSIDGCLEFLDRYPDAGDFFISEEIECHFPDTGLRAHLGAYDINEQVHREVQRLRSNVFEAAAYLRSEGVLYTLNHLFFFFDRQVALERYLAEVRQHFSAFEVRNGTMLKAHNLLTERIVGEWSQSSAAPLVTIGGSDSHTLSGIGTTYTECSGSDLGEFLRNLRGGGARVGGVHGSAVREAREIYGVVVRYWASLLGIGRQDLSWGRRCFGLAFSALSMPCEFVPLLVATLDKRAEARRVQGYSREWSSRLSQTVEVPEASVADDASGRWSHRGDLQVPSNE
jgi:predicted metal-dependent phosphoesterase TrpH